MYVDIDECLNGGCEQTCNNTVGSFFCDCEPGYNLVNASACVGKL